MDTRRLAMYIRLSVSLSLFSINSNWLGLAHFLIIGVDCIILVKVIALMTKFSPNFLQDIHVATYKKRACKEMRYRSHMVWMHLPDQVFSMHACQETSACFQGCSKHVFKWWEETSLHFHLFPYSNSKLANKLVIKVAVSVLYLYTNKLGAAQY